MSKAWARVRVRAGARFIVRFRIVVRLRVIYG